MKMMDCSTLGTLVLNREPIELIDVRSKSEFAAMHIPGARSLPLAELAVPKVFRGQRLTTERVYVISADGLATASFATGMLQSAGYVNAVPVDGGMKDWVARGFPVWRLRFSFRIPTPLIAGAGLLLIAAGVAVALHASMVAILLATIAGLLLFTANFSSRTGPWKSAGFERKRIIKDPRIYSDASFTERNAHEHQDTCAAS